MSYSVIPVFIPHLGCPHDCVFCNQKRIAGKINAPKPNEVSALIDVAFKRSPNAEIAFYGGSFTALPLSEQEEYLKAAAAFSPKAIRLSTRPDAINDAILALLKKYGVNTIELGAQSMEDSVLISSNRGHTAEDVRTASKMIKDAGFNLILQMMVGLPGEDENSAINTAKEIAKLKPNGVRVYPTVVVRDTCLENMWMHGEYTALTVGKAVEICAEITEIFNEKDIPIIRMGLNPTEDLNGGDALSGAYHPAFGQLVKARLRLKQMREILKGKEWESVTIYANPKAISEVAGHKGENKKTLMGEFNIRSISIFEDANLDYNTIKINEYKKIQDMC